MKTFRSLSLLCVALVVLMVFADDAKAQCGTCYNNAIVAPLVSYQPLVSYAPVVQLQQVVQPLVTPPQQVVQQYTAPSAPVVAPSLPVLQYVPQQIVAQVVSNYGYRAQPIVANVVQHQRALIVAAPIVAHSAAIVVHRSAAIISNRAAVVVRPQAIVVRRAPLIQIGGRR